MVWPLLASQLIISLILLAAATGKFLRSEEFDAALRLSHLPAAITPFLSIAVPIVEFAVALALLLSTPRSLPIVFGAAATVLGAFTVWMASVRARRLQLRCGCFGTGGAEISFGNIARNILLLVVALAGLRLALGEHSPLPEPSLAMVILTTSLMLSLALLLSLHGARPALVLSFGDLRHRQPTDADGQEEG